MQLSFLAFSCFDCWICRRWTCWWGACIEIPFALWFLHLCFEPGLSHQGVHRVCKVTNCHCNQQDPTDHNLRQNTKLIRRIKYYGILVALTTKNTMESWFINSERLLPATQGQHQYELCEEVKTQHNPQIPREKGKEQSDAYSSSHRFMRRLWHHVTQCNHGPINSTKNGIRYRRLGAIKEIPRKA